MTPVILALSLAASPAEAVANLAARLESLSSVSFTYVRNLDYGSDAYKHTLKAAVYVEFDKEWKPIGARFRTVSDKDTSAFDGMRYWYKDNASGNVLEDAKYAPEDFESLSVLKNSLVGLAATLRAALKQPNVVIKTSTDESGRNVVAVSLKEQEFGVCALRTVGYDPVYEITIDAKLGLPVKIVQRLSDPRDKIMTTFSDYNLKPAPLDKSAWLPAETPH